MRLIGQDGLLELERSDVGGPGTPPESDLLLNVTVQASSYSAGDQSWVLGDEWVKILAEIATLDERRQGRAVVEGTSREDLRLEFYSTDSAGHMAVQGHLGWRKPTATFCNLSLDFLSNPTCCRLFFGNCG